MLGAYETAAYYRNRIWNYDGGYDNRITSYNVCYTKLLRGINGWCENSAIIIGSEEDAELLEYRDISACVVAQTTLIFEKWQKIIKILNKKFANVLKFDTICSATANRQAEAKKVSLEVDQMVVIGDRDSSNTQKLYELCCVNCPNTIQIEGYGELPPLNKTISKIGITAGASTPEWVINRITSYNVCYTKLLRLFY